MSGICGSKRAPGLGGSGKKVGSLEVDVAVWKATANLLRCYVERVAVGVVAVHPDVVAGFRGEGLQETDKELAMSDRRVKNPKGSTGRRQRAGARPFVGNMGGTDDLLGDERRQRLGSVGYAAGFCVGRSGKRRDGLVGSGSGHGFPSLPGVRHFVEGRGLDLRVCLLDGKIARIMVGVIQSSENP